MLEISDILEQDVHGNMVSKMHNPKVLIRQYIYLFYMDVIASLTEAAYYECQGDKLKGALQTATTYFNSISHHCLQELIESYLVQLRFHKFTSNSYITQLREYNPYSSFNIIAMANFLVKFLENEQIWFIYTRQYLLKILLPIMGRYLGNKLCKPNISQIFLSHFKKLMGMLPK